MLDLVVTLPPPLYFSFYCLFFPWARPAQSCCVVAQTGSSLSQSFCFSLTFYSTFLVVTVNSGLLEIKYTHEFIVHTPSILCLGWLRHWTLLSSQCTCSMVSKTPQNGQGGRTLAGKGTKHQKMNVNPTQGISWLTAMCMSLLNDLDQKRLIIFLIVTWVTHLGSCSLFSLLCYEIALDSLLFYCITSEKN